MKQAGGPVPHHAAVCAIPLDFLVEIPPPRSISVTGRFQLWSLPKEPREGSLEQQEGHREVSVLEFLRGY